MLAIAWAALRAPRALAAGEEVDKVVATVDGDPITLQDVRTIVRAASPLEEDRSGTESAIGLQRLHLNQVKEDGGGKAGGVQQTIPAKPAASAASGDTSLRHAEAVWDFELAISGDRNSFGLQELRPHRERRIIRLVRQRATQRH